MKKNNSVSPWKKREKNEQPFHRYTLQLADLALKPSGNGDIRYNNDTFFPLGLSKVARFSRPLCVPNVQVLAEQLKRCIEQAQADNLATEKCGLL
ncbi:hypothetical protein PI95_014780 [Hassallia byssoidea VB512170]|uniref:Uncharacterized protein n=1 Tax=Hassallia byssoidea VB512170 TaxID=1304833 RepID=A0A846HBF8_9CYAN|nr:hypothetical protein [Hassalia byssoidea]NEU73791.1 hypothetical protein [Hassalia byssoidea VB512170]